MTDNNMAVNSDDYKEYYLPYSTDNLSNIKKYADIDKVNPDFFVINDLGHEAGEIQLVSIAKTLNTWLEDRL